MIRELTMQSHCSTSVISFFICEINEIPQTLQKTESANGGKTRLTMEFIDLKRAEKLEKKVGVSLPSGKWWIRH